ncbi:acyl-CoA dehydrogenase family protein [Sphingomonas jatrophae]|uniref:Acyl-CoA dehydrogenase n=1 Tax=Sphingomonas jatrophae TaxID=1166337 RepID=A0A1I6M1F2_9SPHN|nr:acyl-CoA dehydrogenase family protein [Sphingomonas jatrophae]SFS09546.1 Acyl-CoA dehydrogenase [Sphingomonas jatrophae]
MDFQLSPAELAFRDEVRAFLDERLPDHLRAGATATPTVFAEPDLGREWQRILHEQGWLGYHWPVEHGGTGWSPVQRYIFEKECALASAPGLPVLGLKLLAPVLWTFGTPEQKAHYLPRILTAEDYWCQGFSEPGAGSDLASLKTSARREGDRYIVNGSKIWTTHAHFADHLFCLVRTDAAVKPQAGISFLLIDMNQPGITVRPIIGLAGDHEVNEVFLDEVEVPVSDLVGREGDGWTIAKFLLENERGGSCFAPELLAVLSRLRQDAAQEPDGYGDALIQDASFAQDLARLELSAQALEMTELRILAEVAQGRKPGPQTSLIKLVASSLRQDVDALAMRTYGHAGLQLSTRRPLYGNDSDEPIGSKAAQIAAPAYLNSRAWTIFGGSNEVQMNIIAKTVLGL